MITPVSAVNVRTPDFSVLKRTRAVEERAVSDIAKATARVDRETVKNGSDSRQVQQAAERLERTQIQSAARLSRVGSTLLSSPAAVNEAATEATPASLTPPITPALPASPTSQVLGSPGLATPLDRNLTSGAPAAPVAPALRTSAPPQFSPSRIEVEGTGNRGTSSGQSLARTLPALPAGPASQQNEDAKILDLRNGRFEPGTLRFSEGRSENATPRRFGFAYGQARREWLTAAPSSSPFGRNAPASAAADYTMGGAQSSGTSAPRVTFTASDVALNLLSGWASRTPVSTFRPVARMAFGIAEYGRSQSLMGGQRASAGFIPARV